VEGSIIRIIYIGYVVPEEEVEKNQAVSAPANAMGLGILKSLFDEFGDSLYSINIKPVAGYRRSKTLFVKRTKEILFDGFTTFSVGFVNLPLIKQVTIILSIAMRMAILLWSLRTCHKVLVITVNSNAIVSIPVYLTKVIKKTTKICYMSDYPLQNARTKNPFRNLGIACDNFIRKRSLKMYQASITFVKKCADYFMPAKPTLVIDHIFDERGYRERLEANVSAQEGVVRIVYTGSLNENYRIQEMMECIEYLPSNYMLEFYGKGPLMNTVAKFAKNNPRVKYCGFLLPKDIPFVQMNASILITLLRSDLPLSEFAIPSKIVGYLASGRPVISSRAESIPEKYRKYLNFVDSEEPKDIATKILEITHKNRYLEFERKALQARDFIYGECNWNIQTEQIVRFISSL